MTPGISTVLKIRVTTEDNMLESLRLEAERASRCSGERPFTEIFLVARVLFIYLTMKLKMFLVIIYSQMSRKVVVKAAMGAKINCS